MADGHDVKRSSSNEKRDSGEQGVTIVDSQPPVVEERTLRRDLNSRQISMIAIGGVRRLLAKALTGQAVGTGLIIGATRPRLEPR